ncbi:YheC/YheD family protein [Paenibacillus albiflavus]|uniref:YheC/YheD family protein n=1 Tax=Paenibacillus albiflavus TaxID=2545760 RepID=A0A4R4E8M6_9BACL|nr:YheC/YheD family protein [Paenibacillus albiflavus]TCZ75323.1 YheC/YheD family protein [Paenibacillus albiflavus]
MSKSLRVKSVSKPSPTIGILTVSDDHQSFRGNISNFIDLIQIGQKLGANVFVVTTDELSLSGETTPGFSYDFERKTWVKEHLPIPNVIYNRVPNRSFEMQPQVQLKIKSCMRNKRVKLFNPSFFNKWTLFEWLSSTPETQKFIPATHQLTNANELEMMIRKFPTIYLKPISGKAGKGIMRIDHRSGKIRHPIKQLNFQNNRHTQRSHYTTMSTLWNKIQAYRKSQDYIMQQGIDLVKYNDRPYDLRILIQKSSQGKWKVSGIGARLAGDSSITTHVPRGGSIEDPAELLTSSFGEKRGNFILRRAKYTALLIARTIENKSGQKLGEMSIDLGIDTSGQAWFFEANSKPMKFDEPHIRTKSLERLIRYCKYLSNETSKKVGDK